MKLSAHDEFVKFKFFLKSRFGTVASKVLAKG
jgi:hypothetical protein